MAMAAAIAYDPAVVVKVLSTAVGDSVAEDCGRGLGGGGKVRACAMAIAYSGIGLCDILYLRLRCGVG